MTHWLLKPKIVCWISILAVLLAAIKQQCSGFVPSNVVVRPSPILSRDLAQHVTTMTQSGMMQVWWEGSADMSDEHTLIGALSEVPDVLVLESNHNIHLPAGAASTTNGVVYYQEGSILKDAATNQTVGVTIRLTSDTSGQEQAMAALGSVEWILISSSSSTSWQMIPAENLIAAAQSTGTRLAFVVDKASDVAGLARALELGVDALCVRQKTATPELWKVVFQAREERNHNAAKGRSKVKTVPSPPQILVGAGWRRDTQSIILADRICVDLVQSLLPEEGCWIGSSAKMMTLVLSEATFSPLVPTRPFRVNAGPVHAYILLGDQTTTKYLCELQPADQVSVYNSQTRTSRSVAVGRLKQELRPCVLVELLLPPPETIDEESSRQHPQSSGQIFLQQAETVRLGQEAGSFVRVTDLEAQREKVNTVPLLLRVVRTGTHVGKAYTGKVEER